MTSASGNLVTAHPGAMRGVEAPASVRSIAWPAAFVLSLGSALLVTVSLGPMAAEFGAASVILWIITAGVGFIQCLMVAELASRYPDKVGGVPAYNHEGLKHISPFLGAISAWGYWVGWIPGVAVNLTLAATYLRAAFLPELDVFAMTIFLVGVVYGLNYFGLRFGVWTAGVLVTCALVPLLAIIIVPLLQPSTLNLANFSPLLPTDQTWDARSTLLLAAKWMFVALWSSYGGEMIAAIVGEMHDRDRAIPKALGLAAVATLVAFCIVPTVLVALVGVEAMAQDPYVVFLTAARDIFGPLGSGIVTIMLVSALILGANLFVISSSRALCQMSRDGLTLGTYARTNRYGVPTGSVGWDALVTAALLLMFKDDIIDVVAAANFGYLLVFVLMPIAYILVHRRHAPGENGFVLPGFMTPIAIGVFLFNLTLFVVGGSQWGWTVTGVGALLLLTFLPFYALRRSRSNQYVPPSILEHA